MATTSTKNKIMKLSQAEYTTLSTTGTLTKDGVTYTYSPSDTIYVTPDTSRVEIVQTTGQSTSLVMSQKAVTDELSGKLSNPLIFTNLSAIFTANSDADYVDFDYKAVLTCQSVTANMLATVIFSEAQAKSGNYALTCVTGTDSVTIYSNDDTSITVPTVIAGVPLEVEISGGSGHNYSTDEQVVGTWIDGKPLYEKTYYFNNKVLGTNDTNGELTHGLVDIDMAFVEKALWKFTNDNNYWNDISTIKTQSGSSPSYWHGQMTVGDNTFYDTYNGNTMNASTSGSYIVVVRYTKTTDEAVTV